MKMFYVSWVENDGYNRGFWKQSSQPLRCSFMMISTKPNLDMQLYLEMCLTFMIRWKSFCFIKPLESTGSVGNDTNGYKFQGHVYGTEDVLGYGSFLNVQTASSKFVYHEWFWESKTPDYLNVVGSGVHLLIPEMRGFLSIRFGLFLRLTWH